jgi:hypothetical protein
VTPFGTAKGARETAGRVGRALRIYAGSYSVARSIRGNIKISSELDLTLE